MASIRAMLNDDTSPYTTFNSTELEDSLDVTTRRRNADINGDLADYYESIDSGVEEKPVWAEMFKSCCFKCVDITATVVIISFIWMVMALPTGLYAYNVLWENLQDNSSAMNSNDIVNVNCTLYNATTNVCTPYLKQFTKCLNSKSSSNEVDVYIAGPLNEDAIDKASRDIEYLKSFGPSFVDLQEQCQLSIEPLICLHHVHLCDNNSDIGPSTMQCRHIEDICDHELKKIRQIGGGLFVDDYLSSCASNSPLDGKICNLTFNRTIQRSGRQNVTCSYGFYKTKNGTCLPECNVWSPYSNTTILATDILAISSAVIAVVFGIAVILLSIVHCQKMYRYPTVFIIYQTIPVLVQSIIFLVGFSERRRWFCRSRDWIESFVNPTYFCIITGIIFYYVVMQLFLWWLWHTIAVFWAVAWPFHARKFNTSRNTKYLHIAFALASLLLPVAPVLIVLFVRSTPVEIQSGFTITRFPTFACAGYDFHVNFWAFMFPISLVLATGVTLLVFILRIVIKKHFMSKILKIRVNLNWALELKVLIVLCYYVLLGSTVLTIFTIALIYLYKYIDKSTALFECENGLSSNPSDCTRKKDELRKIVNPYPTTIALLVLGLLPAVNLVYIINIKELKRKLKCSQRRQVHHIRCESSRSTKYVPYKVHQEPRSTLMVHTGTERLVTSSQANNDLRQ